MTGPGANWCTFATWASKQAGQSIRQEDLERAFAAEFRSSPEVLAAAGLVARHLERIGRRSGTADLIQKVLDACDPSAAFGRASDAVALGNKKVFEEIAREFARYVATFGSAAGPEDEKLREFCRSLLPGDPPDGQGLLRDAFAAYHEVRCESDRRVKTELLLQANLLVGYHEQTRLQPEISAALDAALGDRDRLRESILENLLPGFWLRLRRGIAGLFGRRPPLDEALDRLIDDACRRIRHAITLRMMTLGLPSEILRLGSDLSAAYPESLREIRSSRLRELLGRIDPTPDSAVQSGARDWADFRDRMHFIADFFRCYHERAMMFDPPFTAAQTVELKVGRRPAGDL
jgi:hypothetical protein